MVSRTRKKKIMPKSVIFEICHPLHYYLLWRSHRLLPAKQNLIQQSCRRKDPTDDKDTPPTHKVTAERVPMALVLRKVGLATRHLPMAMVAAVGSRLLIRHQHHKREPTALAVEPIVLAMDKRVAWIIRYVVASPLSLIHPRHGRIGLKISTSPNFLFLGFRRIKCDSIYCRFLRCIFQSRAIFGIRDSVFSILLVFLPTCTCFLIQNNPLTMTLIVVFIPPTNPPT